MSPPTRQSGDGEQQKFIDADRAQTVLDYGIAVGIFFVALVFVLGTIPGMFAPFVGGSGDTQVADRLASSLSADMLTHPNQPFVLDETCTQAFFDQMNTGTDAPDHCRFDTTADTLGTAFALDATTDVRVELSPADGGAGIDVAAGDSLPSGTSISTARRTVGVDGETHILEVHVW